ncbi:hypothetical protein [Clostridium weizhouense]|uniref:Variable large protein n=1 Tax=Clostridium weizhouense TaxID=2859781 RepID=A0ABS7AQE2_9CLOT|nr:hypothetical protein [Clostridium weizhouense]MBW6410883.1 hypothetical protein [Clostridium weizhouense]
MNKVGSGIREKVKKVANELKETTKGIKIKMKEEGQIIKEHANNIKNSL